MPDTPTARRPIRHAVGALLLLAVLLLTAAVPAGAASPPSHTGTRGVHVLIDSNEYPGQICHFGTSFPGTLKRIAVRRPVIFAPDVTSGRDQRWVGWRLRLERSLDQASWTTFYTSGIKTAIAYDDQPAVLEPRGRNFVVAETYYYRAAVDLFWYTASSKTTQTGKATHLPLYTLFAGPSEDIFVDPCPASLDTTAATRTVSPAGGSDQGDVGLHTLINTPDEFPGVTCVYNAAKELVRVKVRAPVVYAQDGHAGTQQVRWRFLLNASDEPPDSVRIHTSSWTTAGATELKAARWRGGTVTVDGSRFTYWFVGVRMEWLGPGPNPSALHGAYHRTGPSVFGYCFGSSEDAQPDAITAGG